MAQEPTKFYQTDVATIPDLVKGLRQTYNSHVTQKLSWRLEQLQILHKILSTDADRELICEAMYKDLGRSRTESLTCEVELALSEVIHFIHELRTNPNFDMEKTDTNLLNLPATSYVRNDPYGVVLVSSPWNYPTLLCLQPLAGALAAGNTVLLRPGTYSKHTSQALYELISKNFNPANVSIVVGERAVTHAVLKEKYDLIFFTGGPTLGKLYHQAANENLTPTVLELGGSNPTLVWKDANIDVAAKRLTWGCFLNSGQTCVRPQNLFVHKDVAKEFIQAMKTTINSFYTFGNDIKEYRTQEAYQKSNDNGKITINDFVRQQDEAARQLAATNQKKNINDAGYQSNLEYIKQSPYFGRVITHDACKKMIEKIEKDRQHIVFGGEYDLEKKFISPTIMVFNDIRDFQNSASVSGGEIFGPIVPILIIDNLDTVLEWTNNHDKPLSLYAFVNDATIRDQILKKTSSGSLMFNDCIMQLTNHSLPFGGVGQSGMGYYHGKWSINTFSHQKSVMYKSDFGPADLPVRYPPYTTTAQTLVNGVFAAERSHVLGYLTLPIVALTGYGVYRVAPTALPWAVAALAVGKQWCESGISILQKYCNKDDDVTTTQQAKL